MKVEQIERPNDELTLSQPSSEPIIMPDGRLGLRVELHGAPTTLLEIYTTRPKASARLLDLVNRTMAENPSNTIVIIIHRYKPETINGHARRRT